MSNDHSGQPAAPDSRTNARPQTACGHWLWRWVRRFRLRLREREIARNCGCVTYCPKCRDPLNDQAYWLASNGEGLGTYKCRVCGNVSEWHFGIAPVAVLLWSSHTKSSPNHTISDTKK